MRTVLSILCTLLSALPLLAQGGRIGDSYQDVYPRLKGGPYREVRQQTVNGRNEIVTRRTEAMGRRQVEIEEYYTFTANNQLKMIESHYSCKDPSWCDEFLQERMGRFTSQWGNPTFEKGENYYWWATSGVGDVTMLAPRIRPEDRARYVSIVYTRQSMMNK